MIGKFFFPEAFTTAIRQLSSRKNKVPLEELKLEVLHFLIGVYF